MARQDIEMDAVYGEMVTTDNLPGKVIYGFETLSMPDGPWGNTVLYGEVSVPSSFTTKYSDTTGCRVVIPYLPFNKKLIVRFKSELSGGSTEYVWNHSAHSQWFELKAEKVTGESFDISAAELYQINESGNFNLILRPDYAAVYSGEETDMQITLAKSQNEVFLLKAYAGNLYQHPTTGVGLIEFLHGNFENTGLAIKLQSEFENDRMIINNAYMDSTTGELLLDVTEKDG